MPIITIIASILTALGKKNPKKSASFLAKHLHVHLWVRTFHKTKLQWTLHVSDSTGLRRAMDICQKGPGAGNKWTIEFQAKLDGWEKVASLNNYLKKME